MDHFTRDGLHFGVTDSGGAPAGSDPHGSDPEKTAVLLHGFPQQPSAFDGLLEPLHAAGVRTLVPTQRGYTVTARPTSRRAYRSEETAADVIALIDAAGLDRVHLVGHDWGGFQGWAVAAWYPERVASLTVLSTPHPAAFSQALRHGGQARRSWYIAAFQLPLAPEVLAKRSLRKTLTDSRLPARHVDEYLRALDEPHALSGALGWYRGMPFSRRPVGRITVPTTYVWGTYDFALGRAAAERTERYVQAPYTFVELPSGHWLPETDPDAVASAILERIGSPQSD